MIIQWIAIGAAIITAIYLTTIMIIDPMLVVDITAFAVHLIRRAWLEIKFQCFRWFARNSRIKLRIPFKGFHSYTFCPNENADLNRAILFAYQNFDPVTVDVLKKYVARGRWRFNFVDVSIRLHTFEGDKTITFTIYLGQNKFDVAICGHKIAAGKDDTVRKLLPDESSSNIRLGDVGIESLLKLVRSYI